MAQTEEELRAELERLKAENAALRAGRQRELSLRISPKGAVSLYGLRRFPATFYADEWDRILGMADDIRSFIRKNEGKLSRRGEG